jgi:hypothetical protein
VRLAVVLRRALNGRAVPCGQDYSTKGRGIVESKGCIGDTFPTGNLDYFDKITVMIIDFRKGDR